MTGIAGIGMIGIAFVGLCHAQQFEVASIKPSPLPLPNHLAYTLSDTRVELGALSVKGLITMAYKLEAYQVDGPDSMATTRFDLEAKLPAGAKKEQIPEMLRALLAERFRMVAHHENREQSVYALVPGKDGLKLKEGDPDNSDRSFLTGRVLLNRMTPPENDGMWTISAQNQQTVFNAPRISMPELAKVLIPYVDDPVIDMTGIKGFWQVRMNVPRNRIQAAVAAQAGITPPEDPDGESSIFALIKKLGLVLERRKAPVDHLVVDSIEKKPTEN